MPEKHVMGAAEPGPAPTIEVRRSARRRRTVSARREGERIVVLLPAGLSAAEEERWVQTMVAKLERSRSRPRAAASDAELAARAARLSATYLGGMARPASVRWVGNQDRRWGSCTPSTGAIRLSERLAGMPPYVVDYVLVHELSHLLVPGHDQRFWDLVARYPRTERARGYLEGVSAAAGQDIGDEDDLAGEQDPPTVGGGAAVDGLAGADEPVDPGPVG